MTYDNLNDIKLCYATPSLGMHESHTLPRKLEAIAQAGFTAIELGMPDLTAYGQCQEHEFDRLYAAAVKVGELCRSLRLKVLVLQPHSQFEGYDATTLKSRLDRAERWFKVMQPLGCDMMQVGSNDDRSISSDLSVSADNLRELSDLAAKYSCRIAYEPWCWGTHVNTWKHCFDVLKLVDRPNFGLCLDTFQIIGREWADPSNEDCLLNVPDRDERLRKSLHELSQSIKPEQIFFFQISDAYQLHITRDHPDWTDSTPEAREIWSHSYRPLPCDSSRQGFLPVKQCVKAVLDTGFRGWFSYEVFLDEMKDEKFNMTEFAQLARKSHTQLMQL